MSVGSVAIGRYDRRRQPQRTQDTQFFLAGYHLNTVAGDVRARIARFKSIGAGGRPVSPRLTNCPSKKSDAW